MSLLMPQLFCLRHDIVLSVDTELVSMQCRRSVVRKHWLPCALNSGYS